MIVDGDLTVTGDRFGAALVRTEDSRGGVDDVRLAVVTREIVNSSDADAAGDLPAIVDAICPLSVSCTFSRHKWLFCS